MADNDKVMEGRAGSGWELLRTRNFGLLFSGQVISQIGDGMNKVALLWFVYELTGSAFKMAVIGLLQTIPPLVFGPLIGVYLDRMKKKPVMIWVDLIRTGLVMLIPLLYAMEALTLERLYVLVFATSIVSTVFRSGVGVGRSASRASRSTDRRQCVDSKHDQYRPPDRTSSQRGGDCDDRSSQCSVPRCGHVLGVCFVPHADPPA